VLNTREIDRLAQDFFRIYIPPGWLIREQNPDIHIDYFVEIADSSGPSGIIFGIQLKGTTSLKYSKKYIKISMKTKHITYYLDRVKQPILIIVIDVKNKKGFYLFIQEWVKNLPKRTWKSQKNLVLKIPIENLLSNADQLEEVIRNADIYMRDLWPSSIIAAINYEKHRLEKLDSRCEISISHSNGKTNYDIRPKNSISCKFQIKHSELIQKAFTDFYDRGFPFSLDSNDIINVEGSDLIKDAFGKSVPGKLMLERKYESILLISTSNELNQETSLLYEVKGFLSGGRKEIRFDGGIKETPFRIKCFLEVDEEVITSCHFTITFDYSSWDRLPILQLPFFERIYSFFQAVFAGDAIKIVCEMKGNFLYEFRNAYISKKKNSQDDYEYFQTVYHYLNTINKVRNISLQTGINLILPKIDLISRDNIDDIDMIYELINRKEYRKEGSNIKITANMIPDDKSIEFIKERVNKKLSEPLVLEMQEVKYIIFGREIDLGSLRYTFTNPKLLIDEDITNVKYKKDNSIDIKIIGTEDSELIINKVSP